MARKSLETLTETIFYVLMSFYHDDMCGTEISEYVRNLTNNRINMGPGTLYTILGSFQSKKLIEKKSLEGRKIIYRITDKGRSVYESEIARLRQCLDDAASMNGR